MKSYPVAFGELLAAPFYQISHYRTKLYVVVAQACPHAARTFKDFGLLNAGAHRGRCCATFANWNI